MLDNDREPLAAPEHRHQQARHLGGEDHWSPTPKTIGEYVRALWIDMGEVKADLLEIRRDQRDQHHSIGKIQLVQAAMAGGLVVLGALLGTNLLLIGPVGP